MTWWGFKLKSSSKQISCLTNYARKYQVCWLVGVFLWNLQKFSEHIFWRTSANEYFSIYANDSTIYIVFVHFVVPLYENMYQRKVLFLTFMNSSFFYTSFFLFSYYYKRSIHKTWTWLSLHDFSLIYYTHVLLSQDVKTYYISYNI